MLATEVTSIIKVLLAAFGAAASQDELTRRRVAQIGEVIGAVEDVAAIEIKAAIPTPLDRLNEAHDIIHRVAAILAAEQAPAPSGLVPVVRWDGKPPEGEVIDISDEEDEEEGFAA